MQYSVKILSYSRPVLEHIARVIQENDSTLQVGEIRTASTSAERAQPTYIVAIHRHVLH